MPIDDVIDEERAAYLAESGIARLRQLAEAMNTAQGGEERGELFTAFIRDGDAVDEVAVAMVVRAFDLEREIAAVRGQVPARQVDHLSRILKKRAREMEARRRGLRIAEPGETLPGRERPDMATWNLLAKSESGAPVQSWGAVCTVLESDPRWRGRFGFCLFRFRSLLDGEAVEDNHLRTVRRWLEDTYGLKASTGDVGEAVELLAARSAHHPIRDYLDGLTWDGVRRIESMLERYFGAELPGEWGARHDLYAAYARGFLVSAVARVYQPGEKVDSVLVLYGPQGAGKSTGLKILARGWFRDSHMEIGSKDAFQLLQGAWIYEFAELASLSKREHAAVRNFITSTTDSYRPPFGKHPQDVPRQCVFAGTANPEPGRGLLTDPTGNRRYWVVEVCGRVDTEGLLRDRDQLWAEAVHLYRAGSEHWLSEDLEREREVANSVHLDVDPAVDAMRLVLRQVVQNTRQGDEPRITSQRLLADACGVPAERARGAILRDAVAVLRAEGWRHAHRKGLGWVWVPC